MTIAANRPPFLPSPPGTGALRGEPLAPAAPVSAAPPSFEAVYDEHVDFIWRSARRLGVADDAADDVLQQVLVVLHRRLAEYDGRASMKTWIFAILRRVVADHRRHARRRSPHHRDGEARTDPEALAAPSSADPYENMVKEEAGAIVRQLLAELDDDKRQVFILAELEQMTASEIAEATGTKINTVFSRLRVAREQFEKAAERHRRRDERRLR